MLFTIDGSLQVIVFMLGSSFLVEDYIQLFSSLVQLLFLIFDFPFGLFQLLMKLMYFLLEFINRNSAVVSIRFQLLDFLYDIILSRRKILQHFRQTFHLDIGTSVFLIEEVQTFLLILRFSLQLFTFIFQVLPILFRCPMFSTSNVDVITPFQAPFLVNPCDLIMHGLPFLATLNLILS